MLAAIIISCSVSSSVLQLSYALGCITCQVSMELSVFHTLVEYVFYHVGSWNVVVSIIGIDFESGQRDDWVENSMSFLLDHIQGLQSLHQFWFM